MSLISNDGKIFKVSYDILSKHSEPFRKLLENITDMHEPIEINATSDTLELFLSTFYICKKKIKLTVYICYQIATLLLEFDIRWNECRDILMKSKPTGKQLAFLYNNNQMSNIASHIVRNGHRCLIEPSKFSSAGIMYNYDIMISAVIEKDKLMYELNEIKGELKRVSNNHKRLLQSRKTEREEKKKKRKSNLKIKRKANQFDEQFDEQFDKKPCFEIPKYHQDLIDKMDSNWIL